MPRRSGPTLYEAMKRSTALGSSAAQRSSDSAGSEPERPAASRFLTPGRVIRVPVGYVWIVAGGVILLLALSYVFGYSRGRTISDANAIRFSEGLAETIREGAEVKDPLLNGNQEMASGRVIDTVPEIEVTSDQPAASKTPISVPRRPGPTTREVGKAYFVAETPLAGRAEEICDFIRADGLDAIVVKTDNTRFRQVIILPGFDPADVETRSRLQQRIIEIGRRFESQGRNNDNFDDTYYAVYRG